MSDIVPFPTFEEERARRLKVEAERIAELSPVERTYQRTPAFQIPLIPLAGEAR
jgi:hypothetical protein